MGRRRRRRERLVPGCCRIAAALGLFYHFGFSSFLLPQLLLLLPRPVGAYFGPDGRCRLHVFASFTQSNGDADYDSLLERDAPSGFKFMAAALLAVEHFNERNVSMIPELANFPDCNVQLQIEKVYDTSGDRNDVSRVFWDHLLLRNTTDDENNNLSLSESLCAIAGPAQDTPADDLGAIAYAARIPMVSTYTDSIIRDYTSPMRTSVYPDLLEKSTVLVSFLLHLGRKDFVALLYPLSDKGMQRRSALGVMFDTNNVRWMASEFFDTATYAKSNITTKKEHFEEYWSSRSIREAVKRVKDGGFRTIVISLDHNYESTFLQVAAAINEFGMNDGKHFFIFYEPIPASPVLWNNENALKMIYGSACVLPLTEDLLQEPKNPFSDWSRLDEPRFAVKLLSLNPMDPTSDAYFAVRANLSNISTGYGPAFMYDAVMSIGIGACLAQRQPDGSVDGIDHHNAIRRAKFYGASGRVQFGRGVLERGGTRLWGDLHWFALNYFPYNEQNTSAAVADLLFTDNVTSILGTTEPVPYVNTTVNVSFDMVVDAWLTGDFIGSVFQFADNTTTPPRPLRDPGDQNLISPTFRAVCLSLMGFTMMLSFLVIVWIYVCRKHPILAASQPPFLYVISVGTIVEAAAVLTIAFDDSVLSTTALSRLCMSLPWLLGMGVMGVVSALFTKLLRVHKTLQFNRKRISKAQIVWPMAVLMMVSLFILSLWTGLDPLIWKREYINEANGDSAGSCQSQGGVAPFLVPFGLVALAALILLALMAYKTSDVDEAYSESNWIVILIVVQVEVILVASPVVMRLHDANSMGNINFMVFTFMLLSFPWTTLTFIFGPKALAYWRDQRGIDPNRPKRGQRHVGPRVTGLINSHVRKTSASESPEEKLPDHVDQRAAYSVKDDELHTGNAALYGSHGEMATDHANDDLVHQGSEVLKECQDKLTDKTDKEQANITSELDGSIEDYLTDQTDQQQANIARERKWDEKTSIRLYE
ncbi:hypothetical protein ACA910_012561 [Epithemia clementina (nom. ined.)]